MAALISFLTLIFCFFAIYKVVENLFIKSLDGISDYLKLTPTVAGATLMVIGTCAPEFFTSLISLLGPEHNTGIGLGTIIGASLFHTLVVIGFSGIIKTNQLDWKPLLRDSFFYFLAILQLLLFTRDGLITIFESLLLISTYAFYLFTQIFWSSFMFEKDEKDSLDYLEDEFKKLNHKKSSIEKIYHFLINPIESIIDFVLSFIPDPDEKPKWTLPVFVISLIIIAFLSYFIVISAENIATVIGVADSIVALTIIAIGGSLPELVSTALISKQNRADMTVSNALGGNIFNILVGIGLPTLLLNFFYGQQKDIIGSTIQNSTIILIISLILVLVLLFFQKFKLNKTLGYFLILLYIVYVITAYTGIL